MTGDKRPSNNAIVIFGGAGDLAWRKLIPALFSLYRNQHLPEQFEVVCLDRNEISQEALLDRMHGGIKKFLKTTKADTERWREFAGRIRYEQGDLKDPQVYSRLAKHLEERKKELVDHIFYLAVPPSMIAPIADGLAGAKLHTDRAHSRIVVEKPFGHDLESAQALNKTLRETFHESQIFRIDHYLGKETVQNILAFRFGNTLFEPIWNRSYIDHIQITVAERVGVEHRGAYYERAGALRDMIQNHLLQILCLTAMEAPVSFNADEVRDKKVDVLRSIRNIRPEQVPEVAVRGQYGAGWIEGEHVEGYRSEDSVDPHSATETFAAVKLYVDNWRWQDVPFYLRTGKRLPTRASEVSIQFRPVPHQTFPAASLLDWRPNRLLLAIQPEEGIFIRFEVKQPGLHMRLAPVMMQFYYREAFQAEPPEAYETLLLDIMEGDATLFLRADQAEAGWSVLAPILDVWETVQPTSFPDYHAGSWGPEEAEGLIARDGRNWVVPTFLQCQEDIATCRLAPSE